jgi:hypothetical protein
MVEGGQGVIFLEAIGSHDAGRGRRCAFTAVINQQNEGVIRRRAGGLSATVGQATWRNAARLASFDIPQMAEIDTLLPLDAAGE